MRVVVTGGEGKLGINVCTFLIQTGYYVRILYHNTRRSLGNIREGENKVELCWGDVTQPESMQRALDKIDLVFHMAAVLPPLALQQPELTQKVNSGDTKNLVEAIKRKANPIPFIYTFSVSVFGPTPDAAQPLSSEKHQPNPVDVYSQTKFQAENIIKQSGLDYAILRLTATPYLTFSMKDMKQMFNIPLKNRVEFCHPEDAAIAVGNAIKHFVDVNGKNFLISGGSNQRMLYQDMIGGILGTIGLPLPPEKKFAKEPYCLDWYDTSESESLLHFQRHTLADYLRDFHHQLSRKYGSLCVPFMCRFVGPVFGKAIVQLM